MLFWRRLASAHREESTTNLVVNPASYFAHEVEWVIDDLILAKRTERKAFLDLLYLHYCLRDKLAYDVVTKLIWDAGISVRGVIVPHDVRHLLDDAASDQPQINRWSESTRAKLANSVLTALRDFGLLEGKARKQVAGRTISNHAAEHLVRLLVSEGQRGRSIITDPTWHLFLMSDRDVSGKLSVLASENRLRFEKTGSTVCPRDAFNLGGKLMSSNDWKWKISEAIERIRTRYEFIGRKTGAPFLALIYPPSAERMVLREWQTQCGTLSPEFDVRRIDILEVTQRTVSEFGADNLVAAIKDPMPGSDPQSELAEIWITAICEEVKARLREPGTGKPVASLERLAALYPACGPRDIMQRLWDSVQSELEGPVVVMIPAAA